MNRATSVLGMLTAALLVGSVAAVGWRETAAASAGIPRASLSAATSSPTAASGPFQAGGRDDWSASVEPGPAVPPGPRPGPAPGLRRVAACTPPHADPPGPDADAASQRMQLTEAHRFAAGAGQTAAVIDTGVAPHPRLAGRLRGGGDYLTGGAGLADCDGHGTAVAGILAAAPGGRAGGGVAGMAPAAQVLSIRLSSAAYAVASADGVPRPAGDLDTLADAIVLAVRSGATVVNISEAVCVPAAVAAAHAAPIRAALRVAAQADVVVVAAAGNIGAGSCAAAIEDGADQVSDQVSLPGWLGDDILTVGAVGRDDRAAPFTVPGAWVDVAAPGTDLRSLAVDGGTTGATIQGTSFAAPWVSGLATLLRERFPRLRAAQIADRIVATARRLPGGPDRALGHGVIDPVAALTALPEALTPAPPTPPTPGPTATLAGTDPAPARTPAGPPVETVAVVLGGACAAAAWLLRRGRPAR